MSTLVVEVTEVVQGVHRLALPLGIRGVPTLSAYLLHGGGDSGGGGTHAADGDTLVDCAVAS